MIPDPDDTIVALSSAPGPGARAVIRVGGPRSVAVVAERFRPLQLRELIDSPWRRTPGTFRLTGVTSPLPTDAYFFRAPRSYTGQDLVELHTVSSPPLVERMIADLLAAGARTARPGEFTMRAFLNGKKDLTRAEAVLAVIEANSDEELRSALNQLAGGVARPMDTLRDDLLNLLADVEAGLDFVDEDIEFVDRPELLRRIGAGIAQLSSLTQQLDERTVSGRPIRVVLVGEPNAGKSSLFNELVGESTAALVSPTAGTTRDYLIKRIQLHGVPVEIVDTAGWHEASDAIDAQAQQLGRDEVRRADLILWCVPANVSVPELPPTLHAKRILVRTKSDLPRATELTTSNDPTLPGVAVSVMTVDGLSELRQILTETVQTFARSGLAPSQSRCRHHVDSALNALRHARQLVETDEPQELIALELRNALDEIGSMVGAIYTNDLLDRIFSRFCIGK